MTEEKIEYGNVGRASAIGRPSCKRRSLMILPARWRELKRGNVPNSPLRSPKTFDNSYFFNL